MARSYITSYIYICTVYVYIYTYIYICISHYITIAYYSYYSLQLYPPEMNGLWIHQSPSLQLGQCQLWEALLQKVSLVFVLLLAQPEFESPEASCWMLLDAAGCLKPSRKHHKSDHSQDVGNISDHNFECFMSHYWSCCANLLPTIRKGFRTKTRNKQPIKANITGGIASASFANHSYITHQSDWSHMKHRWSPYLCSCSSPSFSPCEPRWQKTTTAVAYRDVPRIWSQHVSYKIGIGKSTAGSILVDLCCYYHNIL